MTKTKNPILTAKLLSNMLGVCIDTANKYIHDMKDYYKPPSDRVTYNHYIDYFKIPKK